MSQAPVSLAGALEEYLNDPNFEQNRIEYKTNKEAADRNARNGVKAPAKSDDKSEFVLFLVHRRSPHTYISTWTQLRRRPRQTPPLRLVHRRRRPSQQKQRHQPP